MRGVVGVTEMIVDLPQRLIRLITTIKQQQQQLVVDIYTCLFDLESPATKQER